MAKKQLTYEEALKRLEELVSKMESGELSIDQLGHALQESQALIKHCREKLYKTEEQINTILQEEGNSVQHNE